jgi:hypothetical protein
MATNGNEHTTDKMRDNELGLDGTQSRDFETATKHMSHDEKHAAVRAAKFGYGPLAHIRSQAEAMLPGMQLLEIGKNWT